MKYIKYSFFVVVLAAVAGTTGCKKSFLEVNANPNQVTESNVTPELIFPSAANRVGARSASTAFNFIQNWMGYYAQSGDFAIQQDETSYNLDFSFGATIWTGHYDVLFDLKQTERKALAKGDSVLAGASIILQAKLWQELVDLYNNIPYSEAFTATSQPKYDAGAAVYASVNASLDKAIRYMHGTAQGTFASVAGSVLKFGTGAGTSQANWIRFANTLKLRLLIHSSEVVVPGMDRTTELAKIVAEGGVLQAGQTVFVNPGYSDAVGKQMPFYANYGFTPTGADANTSSRANKYSIDTLNARGDLRLTRLYRLAGENAAGTGGTVYAGAKYGQATPSNPGGNALSKQGKGTATNAIRDQWIFTSVESLFLYAEAVQRGWLTGPTPATAYQNAVNESFVFLGLTAAQGTAYTVGQPLANYSSATIVATSPLKFLIKEKYFAMNSIAPLEAYVDYRRIGNIQEFNGSPRTDYLSVNPSRHAGSKLPNRLLYPQEEYTLNSPNALAQGDINKDNIFTTAKIFWMP